MNTLEYCLWCGAEFLAKKVGANPKRFCSERCKNCFHSAARRWAEQALADGRISLKDLKDSASSYTTGRRPLETQGNHPRGTTSHDRIGAVAAPRGPIVASKAGARELNRKPVDDNHADAIALMGKYEERWEHAVEG